jgi:hypothetical protein
LSAAGLINAGGNAAVSAFGLPGYITLVGDRIEEGALGSIIYDGENTLGAHIIFGPQEPAFDIDATSIRVWDSEVDYETQPPTSANLTTSQAPICQTCSFLRWGGWTSTITTEVTGTTNSGGLWVAGESFRDENLPRTGVATYQGSAHGTVSNGGQQYQATGNLGMTWNFGQRAGTMSISNFDTQNVEGGITVSGPVYGLGEGRFNSSTLWGSSGEAALASGAFVAGPSNIGSDGPLSGVIPEGVAGTWHLSGQDGYTAAGVFGGTLLQSPAAR